MDTLSSALPISDLFHPVPSLEKMQTALDARNYPAFYACLRQYDYTTLSGEDGHHLLCEIIQNGLTLRAFQTVLEHMRPESLNDFVEFPWSLETIHDSLLLHAIRRDRVDCLKLLLESDLVSPPPALSDLLNHTLTHVSAGCLAYLTAHYSMDWEVTIPLLDHWVKAGTDPELDRMLHQIAAKILGTKPNFNKPVPLHPFLTLGYASYYKNWDLVLRLCQTGQTTRREHKQTIETMLQFHELDFPKFAQILDALFTKDPGLLHCHVARYALVVCLSAEVSESNALLTPWLEKMPGRQIPLPLYAFQCYSLDSLFDESCFPTALIQNLFANWNKRFGPRLIPVLNQNFTFDFTFDSIFDSDDQIKQILSLCRITGAPPENEPSSLARALLRSASPALLAELMQPGQFLHTQSFHGMLNWCRETKRRDLIPHLISLAPKEERYEL